MVLHLMSWRMKMRYKRYDKYKETGVEWLPKIPEGWDLKGLRYCCKFTVGWTPSTKNPAYFDGKNIWVTIADMKSKYIDDSANYVSDLAIKESNVSIIPKGSLLYSFKLSVGKVAFAGKDVYTNEAIFAVLPAKEYSLTYLYYSFPIEVIYNASENIYGAKILNQELIKSANIVFPPLNEQKQIADYLDKKTSKIDLLLQRLGRQKELLVEKRSALINKAVTRGLNTDVKMKKTGIEWLPEVPNDWEVKNLKYIIKDLESGVSVNSTEVPCINEELGILKTSCVYDYSFNPSENKAIISLEVDRAKTNPRANSIIISRMNTPDLVGASGYVDKNYYSLFLPDRLWQTVFFDEESLCVKWLSFILISESFRKVMTSLATGTSPSMKNLAKEDLLSQKIPYPKYNEQKQIAEYLEQQTAKIDLLQSKTDKQIELLKEYRTSLITSAVTGQIKIASSNN